MSSPGRPIRVAVVTGSRAEFGLLESVMRAVGAREALDLQVIVDGQPRRVRPARIGHARRRRARSA